MEPGGRPDWVRSITLRDTPFCCGPNLWCVLDTVTRCKSRWLCNRHDLEITRYYIHCGDEYCTEDHG